MQLMEPNQFQNRKMTGINIIVTSHTKASQSQPNARTVARRSHTKVLRAKYHSHQITIRTHDTSLSFVMINVEKHSSKTWE